MTSPLRGAVFVTGNLAAGVQQAFAAAISGFLFTVLRVHIGSIYPVMLLHTLWDFSIFTMVSSPQQSLHSVETPGGLVGLFAPCLLVLPNFLCALYPMRRVKRE